MAGAVTSCAARRSACLAPVFPMRSTLRRFLLALVLVTFGLVVWRAASGPQKPSGQVVIDGASTFRLYGRAFVLDEAARVAVSAVGSVGPQDSLEVTAWLLDARTRRPVWTMDARRAERLEGSLVRASNTLDLPAGKYELYLSTWGRGGAPRSLSARVFDRAAQWRNDHRRWYATATPLGNVRFSGTVKISDQSEASGRLEPSSDATEDTSLLWRVNARGEETSSTFLAQPAPGKDSAVLVLDLLGRRLGTDLKVEVVDDQERAVWTLPRVNAPADVRGDQRATVRVPLPAGTYRITYDGPNRGPGRWGSHPPLDPAAWGLSVRAGEGSVRLFDPYTSLDEVLRIRADEPSRTWEVPFEVLRETKVVVAAMGEISSGSVYDGGGIYRGSDVPVWELSSDNSTEAGGVSKNRQGMRTLTLAPGRYTARFHTDDSHYLGSWNSDSSAPDHPERWGLALFAFTPEDVQVRAEAGSAAVPEPPRPPGTNADLTSRAKLPTPNNPLASMLGMGDGASRRDRFDLDQETEVTIYATGEFVGSSAYDYAWIEDAKGNTVWRMDERNSDDVTENFRRAEDRVTLPAGRYTLRYASDGSTSAEEYAAATGADHTDYGVVVTKD